MSIEPHIRFLGVSRDAGPAALLGLSPEDRRNPAKIEDALRWHLAKLYDHPDRRSPDADLVRRSLRAAAEALRAEIRQLGPVQKRPALKLTDFDRSVLAVLVAYGGWNAASRARLVALAASQGVAVMGLIKVIRGLAEHARTGGQRLAVSQFAPAGPAALVPAGDGGVASSPLLGLLMPEFKQQGTRTTIKLSVFFGLLTLLVGILAIRLLLPEQPAATPPAQDGPPPRSATVSPSHVPSVGDSQTAPATPPARDEMARFERQPTFQAQRRPDSALAAVASIGNEIEALSAVARQLMVSRDPAEMTYRSWDAAVQTIATAWMLLDSPRRTEARTAIFDVLYETSGAPTISDRLLRSFNPPVRLNEPLDAWRGAYMAGMLGAIASSAELPPAVSETARTQLQVALEIPPRQGTWSAEYAAGVWLDQRVQQLVRMPESQASMFEYWELWLIARRDSTGRESFYEAVMGAVEHLLQNNAGMSRTGPKTDVLGRLLATVDFEQSEAVQRGLMRMIQSPSIESRQLWLATSIIARYGLAGWFDAGLVVGDDEELSVRRRSSDNIQARWPVLPGEDDAAQRTAGLRVDAAAAARWLELEARAASITLHSNNEAALMRQLVIAAQLNEAAALLSASATNQATRLMNVLERALAELEGDRSAAANPANPTRSDIRGTDGNWAAAYDEARRNTDEKLRLLASLRQVGDDLGPADAAVLAREVYRGTPSEVRALAQEILVDKFSRGLNVALEMLDQLPDAPRHQSISDMLTTYAGALLPSAGSGGWSTAARLSLVGHVRNLLAPAQAVDTLSIDLARSYELQAGAARGSDSTSARGVDASAASGVLFDAWREHAFRGGSAARSDVAVIVARYEVRLRLAEGPVQRCVAGQLGVLDMLALLTAAERPETAATMRELLAGTAQGRASVTHVLEQAVLVEQTINTVWIWRMGLDGLDSGGDL